MCHGRGRWNDAYGYVICPCVRVPAFERDLEERQARIAQSKRGCEVCRGRGSVRLPSGKMHKCRCTNLSRTDQRLADAIRDKATIGNTQTQLF